MNYELVRSDSYVNKDDEGRELYQCFLFINKIKTGTLLLTKEEYYRLCEQLGAEIRPFVNRFGREERVTEPVTLRDAQRIRDAIVARPILDVTETC